jgi:hypothetical protein
MTLYCEVCGKKLNLLQRYNYPSDRHKTVCSKCFDLYSKDLEDYRKCLKEGKHHYLEYYFLNKKRSECKIEKYYEKNQKLRRIA